MNLNKTQKKGFDPIVNTLLRHSSDMQSLRQRILCNVCWDTESRRFHNSITPILGYPGVS